MRHPLASPFFALALAALALGGCRDDRRTCDQFRQKSFDPMPEKAIAACAATCEDGYIQGCGFAADHRLKAGRYDEARALYQKVCTLKQETNCSAAERVDEVIAKKVYQKKIDSIRVRLRACRTDPGPCRTACVGGELAACAQLGEMYTRGLGVARTDLEQGQAWYAKACALHDAERICSTPYATNPEQCQDERAVCDEMADGICPPGRAPGGCDAVYSKSVEPGALVLGCSGRQACDAVMHQTCLGAPQRCVAACEAGDGARCRQVARMYGLGLGVPLDPDKARIARSQACRLGDAVSCERDHPRAGFKALKPQPL